MKEIPFNLNSSVKVQLTPEGHRLLKERHEKFWTKHAGPGALDEFPYRPPMEDASGWSKWQLWVLMQKLGEHMGKATPPIKMKIILCDDLYE